MFKSLFRRRRAETFIEQQTRLAKLFRNIVGQCAYGKKPMTVTVKCDGYESFVTCLPSDNLTAYLFQWAQGVCFQLMCEELPHYEAANDGHRLDDQNADNVRRYLTWYANKLIEVGEFPAVMISRREPQSQHVMVSPGYDNYQVKQILEQALKMVPNLRQQSKSAI